MNKERAEKFFKTHIDCNLPKHDKVMRREAWHFYIDNLCRNGEITMAQYERWMPPRNLRNK